MLSILAQMFMVPGPTAVTTRGVMVSRTRSPFLHGAWINFTTTADGMSCQGASWRIRRQRNVYLKNELLSKRHHRNQLLLEEDCPDNDLSAPWFY
jgi:hypothetical protein